MNIGTLNDFLDDCSNGLYDFTHNGKCSQCGNCCSKYLPVTQHEINTIKQYIKNHNIGKAPHGLAILKNPTFDLCCPFLDMTKKKNKCSIYPVRPQICREFICNETARQCSKNLASAKIRIVDFEKCFFED